MRTRKMDVNGDVVFGAGRSDYLVDVPEAVAQSAQTRMALHSGSWFTDSSDGMPYDSKVLGERTFGLYDAIIRKRLLGTTGVTQIADYNSSFDSDSRGVSVTATLDTVYGKTLTTVSF